MTQKTKKKIQETQKVKENFVGPKNVIMTFVNCRYPLRIQFPTSISYNRAINSIIEATDVPITVKTKSSRLAIDPASVESIYFPIDGVVLRKKSSVILKMELIFDDLHIFHLPIAGENRAWLMYNKLLPFLMIAPPDNPQFLKISQEENKFAYILHYKTLRTIRIEYSNNKGE